MIDGSAWGYSESDDSVRVIFEVYGGDGYDWNIRSIVRNDAGEYALYWDSGCSCTGAYWQSPNECDLSWNSDLMEIIRQARESIREGWGIDADRKANALSELSTLRYREGLK